MEEEAVTESDQKPDKSLLTLDYRKQIVPQLLWIANLFHSQPAAEAIETYNKVASDIDRIATKHPKFFFIGLISDFDFYQGENLPLMVEVIRRHPKAFPQNFIDLFSNYRKSPSAFRPLYRNRNSRSSIRYLEVLLSILTDKDGTTANLVQAVPMYRFVVARQRELEKLASLNESVEMLDKAFAAFLAKGERAGVKTSQLVVQTIMEGLYGYKNAKDKWSRDFWLTNLKISKCKIYRPRLSKDVQDLLVATRKLFDLNCKLTAVTLSACLSRIKLPDDALVDRDKYSVLFGNLSLVVQQAIFVLRGSVKWDIVVSNMLLRGFLESSINYLYLLSERDNDTIFDEFIETSKRSLKRIMILLKKSEDSGSISRTPLGQDRKQISTFFFDDSIDFHMTDETKERFSRSRRYRKFVSDLGIGTFYQIAYRSSSNVLHGDWSSIQLIQNHCVNPLHDAHTIPSAKRNPIVAFEPILYFIKILRMSLEATSKQFGFPDNESFEEIRRMQLQMITAYELLSKAVARP